MTDTPDLLIFLEHHAQRWERVAKDSKADPKNAELWYSRATGMHAVMRELRRLQRIETLARAVDAIFDERQDSIRLRCRVADGNVDHREPFLKLRAALLADVPCITEAKGPTT